MNRLRKVQQVGPEKLGITIFSLAELLYGAYHSQRVEQNIMDIQRFTSKIKVFGFDDDAADFFGKIKAGLRKTGQIIEDLDILIASTVLSHGAVLVTNNTSHFARIDGLRHENWLEK